MTVTGLIFALPILLQWKQVARWLYRLTVHSGPYGTGPANIIETSRATHWLAHFGWDYGLYLCLFLGSGAICVASMLAKRVHRLYPKDFRIRVLVACFVFHGATLLMVAKHPNDKYMIPSLGMIIVTSLLSARFAIRYYSVNISKPARNMLKMLVLPILAILTLKCMLEKLNESNISTQHHLSASYIANSVSKKELLVTGNYASCWERAVSFGNGYAGSWYTKVLGKEVNQRFEYDIFTGNVFVYYQNCETAHVIFPEVFFTTNQTVLLQLGFPGLITMFPIRLPPGHQVRSLGGWPEEAFFWIGSENNISNFNMLRAQILISVAQLESKSRKGNPK